VGGHLLHRIRLVVRVLVPRRLRPLATRVVGRALAVALRGSRVECPCCGGRFRRFISYPSRYCPRCGSYERHRLLALHLDRHPELLTPPLRMLQVSPDRALERRLRRPGISRISIDIDNPTVDLQMDVQELAFADGSFDVVLCLDVLDSVPDRTRALRELQRVLRPRGLAIFQVPLGVQPELVEALRAEQLQVEIVRAADLGRESGRRYGLIPEEETYVCRKPDLA
jgi:SAM-dependent methyltransferase